VTAELRVLCSFCGAALADDEFTWRPVVGEVEGHAIGCRDLLACARRAVLVARACGSG